MANKELNLGLVLSGGGVRGMAHIGLIQALEEHGLSIAAVSGSSVGALIGALYCNGHTVEDMLRFFRSTPLFKYNYVTWNKPGIVDTDRYYPLFKNGIGAERFEQLQKPLYVMTTNLERGEYRAFHTGDLIKPVLASAALPPYFSPVKIEDEMYADGGIMNNFPTEPLEGEVDLLVGSNVSMVRDVIRKEITSSLQLVQRSTDLMMYAMNKPKLEACDLLFQNYELESIGILEKKKVDLAFEMGYKHAKKVLKNWEAQAHTSS